MFSRQHCLALLHFLRVLLLLRPSSGHLTSASLLFARAGRKNLQHQHTSSLTVPIVKMQLTTVIALSCLLLPATARVAWMPAEFDPNERPAIAPRDTASVSCGASFPDDFTCPQSTSCLPLNTTSSVKAVLCCPAGQDCSVIAPISCEQSAQNATTLPDSELHADPTMPLQTCGSACCPMGYTCQNNQCYAQSASAAAAAASSASSSSTASTTSSAPSSSSSGAAASSTNGASVTAGASSSPVDGSKSGSSTKFSGASFAAGFVPGILLGALLAACLLLCLFRKKHRSSDSYINEKQSPRDTLTDLGTLSRRPTAHGRSISEPTIDPSVGHRTDFLRNTPPRIPPLPLQTSYTVEATGPVTPARTPKAVRALFSRSPFLNQTPASPQSTQPPLPGHLKRGTLSFKISPVRALKKQKSMHSLRRQMTEVSRNSSRRLRPDVSQNGSTETIQVLMPSNEPYTPDQRPTRTTTEDAPGTLDSSIYRPHNSDSTWRTSGGSISPPQAAAPVQYASSSRYPTQTFTPTRPPGRGAGSGGGAAEGRLGTPYTPSGYNPNGKTWVTDVLISDDGGLKVVRDAQKRDTTFSGMMERAGLRKSDLQMGSGNHR